MGMTKHSPIVETQPDQKNGRRPKQIDAIELDVAVPFAHSTPLFARANGVAQSRTVHQLQRTVGNSVVQRLLTRNTPTRGVVQTDGDSSLPSVPRLELTPPSRLRPNRPSFSFLPELRLEFDPHLSAEMRARQLVLQLLDPEVIQRALRADSPGSDLFTVPMLPPPAPLVPRGAGPSTPRPASPGDLIRAVMAVPAISSATTRLQMLALDQLRNDWGRLSTGERVAAISTSAAIGVGALAGIASDPSARRFMLNQLNGRVIPVPGIKGFGLELNTEGTNVMVGLHFDVGRVLPPILGFGPSSPSPLGGPPQPGTSP